MVESGGEDRAQRVESMEVDHGLWRNLELEGSQMWKMNRGLLRSLRTNQYEVAAKETKWSDTQDTEDVTTSSLYPQRMIRLNELNRGRCSEVAPPLT